MIATITIPEDVIEDLAAEVLRARAKFPRNRLLTVAALEELGELAAAQLQQLPKAEIRREAIQAMAILVRIITEGDATLEGLDAEASQK
jgi:hypothetical protein